MTALTRNVSRRAQIAAGVLIAHLALMPVAAATHIYQGAAVALTASGYLTNASADPSLRVVGLAEDEADNTNGSAGDLSIKPRRGAHYFANSSTTDAVTDTDVGRACYVVDNNTVARTSAAGLRPVMGRVLLVDDAGVLVELGVDDTQTELDLMLLANEDLSSKQFHFVDLTNSSGTAAVVACSAAGQRVAGVLQNAPASGAVAIIRPIGCGRTTKVISGGSVTAGDTLGSTAAGRAKTAVKAKVDTSDGGSASDPVIASKAAGIALTSGATNGDAMYAVLSAIGAEVTTAN